MSWIPLINVLDSITCLPLKSKRTLLQDIQLQQRLSMDHNSIYSIVVKLANEMLTYLTFFMTDGMTVIFKEEPANVNPPYTKGGFP